MTENTAPAPIDVVPFTLMKRDTQQRHLASMHGVSTWDVGSKTTKAKMEVIHNKHHAGVGRTTSYSRQVAHTHSPIVVPVQNESGLPLSPEEQDGLKQRLVEGKILNTTERRALEKLVDNDFAALKTEVAQMGADLLSQRLDVLKTEWAEKTDKVALYVRKVEATWREAQTQTSDIRALAAADGVTLKVPEYSRYGNAEGSVEGFATAERAIKQEVDADLKRALNTLERSRLTAQRTVLLSAVSAEAAKVLDAIPSAKDLMMQASAARQNVLTQ